MAHPHVPAGLSSPTIGKRLEDIGWALFLILTGILWILPEGRVPPGTWLIGTGLLLLGLNAIRLLMRVPLSWFTTLLGGLALLAGVSTLWGLGLPVAAICLILLGTAILVRQFRG